jgi:hypothetical protein
MAKRGQNNDTAMTLRMPLDLRERMWAHPEILWSVIARRAFEDHLKRLEAFDAAQDQQK